MPAWLPSWLLALLIGIPAWELLRWRFLGRIKARFQRQALAYVRRHRIQLEAGRFLDRVFLRQALQSDPKLDEAIAAAARERGQPFRELERSVEAWIEEMAPAFSLAAYYRIGARVARWSVNLLYEPVFDEASYRRAVAQIPPESIVVFVINHRSNADYVLLSYGLLRHMTLSYAVGEWARVWPLDALFRAFGSFFIRRGEKDRLYHAVLERFVQLLVLHGGTMGFFPEGGLSRDGRLRPAKAGLLDYIVGVQRDRPDRELVFVPVGLCFDHVLEDRWLINEQRAEVGGGGAGAGGGGQIAVADPGAAAAAGAAGGEPVAAGAAVAPEVGLRGGVGGGAAGAVTLRPGPRAPAR